MALTEKDIIDWFTSYFEDINKYQGDLKTVPKLKRFFEDDFKLILYTYPTKPNEKTENSRDGLLMSFVHPGLLEELVPNYYVVNIDKMMVAVQFEARFIDKRTGRKWIPMQSSAYYHLVISNAGDIRIRKIDYWTETVPEDLMEVWAQYREEALNEYAMALFQD